MYFSVSPGVVCYCGNQLTAKHVVNALSREVGLGLGIPRVPLGGGPEVRAKGYYGLGLALRMIVIIHLEAFVAYSKDVEVVKSKGSLRGIILKSSHIAAWV